MRATEQARRPIAANATKEPSVLRSASASLCQGARHNSHKARGCQVPSLRAEPRIQNTGDEDTNTPCPPVHDSSFGTAPDMTRAHAHTHSHTRTYTHTHTHLVCPSAESQNWLTTKGGVTCPSHKAFLSSPPAPLHPPHVLAQRPLPRNTAAPGGIRMGQPVRVWAGAVKLGTQWRAAHRGLGAGSGLRDRPPLNRGSFWRGGGPVPLVPQGLSDYNDTRFVCKKQMGRDKWFTRWTPRPAR